MVAGWIGSALGKVIAALTAVETGAGFWVFVLLCLAREFGLLIKEINVSNVGTITSAWKLNTLKLNSHHCEWTLLENTPFKTYTFYLMLVLQYKVVYCKI